MFSYFVSNTSLGIARCWQTLVERSPDFKKLLCSVFSKYPLLLRYSSNSIFLQYELVVFALTSGKTGEAVFARSFHGEGWVKAYIIFLVDSS